MRKGILIVKTLSAELASSTDNKVAVYALMDKIGFDRQKYRLGHTIIFFRAGALAALEEVCSLGCKAETFLRRAMSW